MEEFAPWINVIHCFNHNLELAVKDTFDKTLFYLYRKSPKCLMELKIFSEMYDHSIPKPYKLHGSRWIAHKVKAMEIVLNNYGAYIKSLESPACTDSQALN